MPHPETSESLPSVDRAGLDAALADASRALLVEFMAPHCVWCQRLEPVLLAARAAFAERLQMLKVDVEQHPDARPEGVPRATPTLAVFRNGKLVMTKSGMLQRQQLDVFLNHWLDPANEGLG